MMKFQSIILAVIFSVFSVSAFAETVNLNKANAAALQHYLKGIGNKKAQDIIEYRKQHSGFKSLKETLIKSNYFQLAKSTDIFHEDRRNRVTITSHFVKNSDRFFFTEF